MSQPFYTLSIAKHLHRLMRLPIGSAGPEGTYEASWSEPPNPGIRPGMAGHAPNQDRWW